MRFLPVTANALLVELDDLEATLALFGALERAPLPGITELVPAARTLLVRFRPDMVSAADLTRDLAGRDMTGHAGASGPVVDIPVRYDGEDLGQVAELLGISSEEVIRRHTESEYTVAFTGFAPGFAYMTAPDARLDVPRRSTPRARIAAGAVGLAGPFSGIYPRSSPGGWQIIGVTPIAMFDLARAIPSLLQPGHRVRFRDMARLSAHAVRLPETETGAASAEAGVADDRPIEARLRVIAAERPLLFQDFGRPGLADQGISASGALDRTALADANGLVGNAAGTPCLEIVFGGAGFEALGPVTLALAGAAAPITVETRGGRCLRAPHQAAISLAEGDIVRLGPPGKGMRSYLAVRGGFAVAPILGSAATDTLSGLGPAAVTAGAHLAVLRQDPGAPAGRSRPRARDLPGADAVVTLDVVLGPRTDWFLPEAAALLRAQAWQVTPQSNRIGIRLAGDRMLARAIEGELPSEGTVAGAIQVPPSGQPVLFLADHPLTGGYPVIATVADHHLDLAGQIPIGARIRFNPLGPFEPVAAG